MMMIEPTRNVICSLSRRQFKSFLLLRCGSYHYDRHLYCCRHLSYSTRIKSIIDDNNNTNVIHPEYEIPKSVDVSVSTSSRSVDFVTAKCGIGNVVATANRTTTSGGNNTLDNITNIVTQLSTVSHKSPVRLIPTTSSMLSCVKQISISHYGGGMTEGDSAIFHIHVQDSARLHVRTQGINRVYGHGKRLLPNTIVGDKVSINRVEAIIETNGLLVYAPDPVSLHTCAQYQQRTDYILNDPITSNLVAVDWICSGRRYSIENEYWNHTSCTTRTTVQYATSEHHQQKDQQQSNIPVLIDAQSITAEGMYAFTTNTQQFHAVVTVILAGSMVVNDNDTDNNNESILQRFIHLQSALTSSYTSVRQLSEKNENQKIDMDVQQLINEQLSLGGRVVIGITKTMTSTARSNEQSVTAPIYTIRLGASSNEDIYRILHYCLQPLSIHMDGIECYKDRIITASRSSPTKQQQQRQLSQQQPTMNSKSDKLVKPNEILASLDNSSNTNSVLSSNVNSTKSNFWSAYMLADSALPIGSFAHSSGIEVVHQLGFLQSQRNNNTSAQNNDNEDDSVVKFIQIAVASSIQLSTPLLWCSSCLTQRIISQLTKENIDDQEQQLILETFCNEFTMLDSYTQAMFSTNGPSCRASLDQGRNLVRVSQSAFFIPSSSPSSALSINQQYNIKIMSILENVIDTSEYGGHMVTTLGVITRLLGLNENDVIELYGYCVARDIVNAAVRLNLIGPMAGQTILLLHAQPAANESILRAQTAIDKSLHKNSDFNNKTDRDAFLAVLSTAMGCAPILDTIHPCHDILSTRLFRT